MAELLDITAKLRVGDPLDLTSDIGAVASKVQLRKNLDAVARAEAQGAKRLVSGEQIRADSGGNFMAPAILAEVTPAMEVWREEVFGPVLSVTRFDGEEDAVALADARHAGCVGGVDRRSVDGASHGAGGEGGRRARQRLWRRRHHGAARRLQAIRLRTRQVAPRSRCLYRPQDRLDRAMTPATTERAGVLDRLLDAEQERFRAPHPRSAAAWREGRQHFLYGGPSHWMRRWAGGFPICAEEAQGAHIRGGISTGATISISASATPAACAGTRAEAVTEAALDQLGRGATMMLPTEDSLWVGAELSRRFGRNTGP